MTGQIANFGAKHCEDECNFPSSCHWKEEYVVRETGAANLDPFCLETGPEASLIKSKGAVPPSMGTYTDTVGRPTGERTVQVAEEDLSRSAEEDQNVSPSLEPTLNLNGLGLHSLTMDLSSYQNGTITSREAMGSPQIENWTPKKPRTSAQVDSIGGDVVEMRDWMIEDISESRSISPYTQPETTEVPFDFSHEQDKGFSTFLNEDDDEDDDEDWVVSRRGSALDWSVGGIGVALSPPDVAMEDAEMG